jgi:hypothetical protein
VINLLTILALFLSAQRLSVNDVFKSLNPIGERKINLNFSASPIGSVKAFENGVKRQKRLTRAANAA